VKIGDITGLVLGLGTGIGLGLVTDGAVAHPSWHVC